jgi:hypothetical protein
MSPDGEADARPSRGHLLLELPLRELEPAAPAP